MSPDRLTPVVIQREEWGAPPEEVRTRTRADLLVRIPGATILVEAKVHAGEQADQCARLAEDWVDENPVFVFLTRDRRAPITNDADTEWKCLSWADIAIAIAAAAADLPAGRSAAPGALDYLNTLANSHGSEAWQPT